MGLYCFQWFKDTNLKANHNMYGEGSTNVAIVSNGSKILIWKQITTVFDVKPELSHCFQWFKDTNLKANHNFKDKGAKITAIVSNGSKILIWKQITTTQSSSVSLIELFPMVQRY